MKKEVKFEIEDYPFTLKLVPKGSEELDNGSAIYHYNTRTIYVIDNVDRIRTLFYIRYQLTNVFIMLSGRGDRKNFTKCELLEFVAYKAPQISKIMTYIEKELYSEGKE